MNRANELLNSIKSELVCPPATQGHESMRDAAVALGFSDQSGLVDSLWNEFNRNTDQTEGFADSVWDESIVDYTYYDLYDEDDRLISSEKDGKKVTLNKPFRTSDGPKKFSVYVKNDKGNVVKVNFGDPNMEIKRDDPARRRSYRARHNCDNPGPKWKANYWSCKMWSTTNVSDLT